MKRLFTTAILILGFLSFSSFLNDSSSSYSFTHHEGGMTINFQELTLIKALQLAKKQNKKVFINVYATWCGPCKLMMAKTYTNKLIGDYFNKNFININLDVENNPEGMKIVKRYGVRAHPCLLFLNSNGILNEKIMGYYQGTSLLKIVKQKVK